MIRLYFRASEYRGFDDFITSYPDYYRVTEYPEAEMLGVGLAGWARDLVRITRTAEWQQNGRRAIQPGDLMVCKQDVCLFVLHSDDIDATQISDYPELAIKRLHPKLVNVLIALFKHTGALS